MTGFAVVDVETTGLSPARHDRIAEIAIVHVDPGGRIVDEWDTLVNPERDLGASEIHGIRASDVRYAPRFRELAPRIAELLAGRVFVAHNVAFDRGFLRAEFDRIGIRMPFDQTPGLCTMALGGRFLATSSRSLTSCCAAAGVPLTDQHRALDDARAAAGLLRHYLHGRTPVDWNGHLDTALAARWPLLPHRSAARPVRRGAHRHAPHFLERIAERLPRVPDPAEADAYLAVLDTALYDRHVSATEADALVSVAAELGLDRATTLELHALYLRQLARQAWADGVVSDTEREDLDQVAEVLGLPESAVAAAVSGA
ncbi:3'-5' exonuclease [Longispora urticae]